MLLKLLEKKMQCCMTLILWRTKKKENTLITNDIEFALAILLYIPGYILRIIES